MKKLLYVFLTATPLMFTSCSNDDDADLGPGEFDGDSKTFQLQSKSDATISGTATFVENADGTATVNLDLEGVTTGSHPAHIHANSAAEGGDIVIDLTPVDASGESVTIVTATNAGAAITYTALLEFDGYINVHQSTDDLGTLIAQGDVGINELTGDTKEYALNSVTVPTISGTATLSKRVSGASLLEVQLEGTPADGIHPGHIHVNSAAEGGGIAISLTPVDGASGYSATHIEATDEDAAITYADLLEYDGYINIHLSADDLTTLVAQGDIGINELTEESKEYVLNSVTAPTISGMATIYKRVSGAALLEIALEGTPDGGAHPAHIHANTAAEGGDILISLATVDGTTGKSLTHIDANDADEPVSYEDLLDFDGYINVHLSDTELSVLVAQGDIGQNELTGTAQEYDLAAVSDAAIFGTATFAERVNGETLVTLAIEGTVDGGVHPAHVHMGAVADAPGGITVSLNSVTGLTGTSMTNVTKLDDDTPIDYAGMIAIDGYVNVHASVDDLATLIAQGNVGANN
ncbi:CHRD domain-containing protein [uncultured Kriegella sp.]|uniref:CHRD domain-containing protein n=1 Tax=uncultured Kriegella sp. TaxID=1798910 RepID=UPI0030DB7BE4|tara:strand:- start:131101 stop:132669 length:1569 start_codon:yes stop_codon:yes gene_type:complete